MSLTMIHDNDEQCRILNYKLSIPQEISRITYYNFQQLNTDLLSLNNILSLFSSLPIQLTSFQILRYFIHEKRWNIQKTVRLLKQNAIKLYLSDTVGGQDASDNWTSLIMSDNKSPLVLPPFAVYHSHNRS